MTLRPAVYEDWARLLAWRNDPASVLAAASANVALDEHLRWLADVFAGSDTYIFIGRESGDDAGMVRLDRLDRQKGVATLSVVVDPQRRGQGFGRALVALACDAATRLGLRRVRADVKADNYASLRLFVDEGFQIDLATVAAPFVTFYKELA